MDSLSVSSMAVDRRDLQFVDAADVEAAFFEEVEDVGGGGGGEWWDGPQLLAVGSRMWWKRGVWKRHEWTALFSRETKWERKGERKRWQRC